MGRARGFFVTATDTGVGKTLITAAIAMALQRDGASVAALKPVQSGHGVTDSAGDTMLLNSWLDLDLEPETMNVVAYDAPLAPLVAARRAGQSIRLEPIVQRVELVASRHEVLVIEGAGGLLAPVGEAWTIADLAVALDYPLIVVARAALGTVNHTLLTLQVARSLGLAVACVVLNTCSSEDDPSNDTNGALIAEFGDVDVVGPLPWLGDQIDAALIRERLVPHLDASRLLAVQSG